MGRRHLSRLLLLLSVLVVAAPAAAASTVPFHVVARSIAEGRIAAKPFAILGTSRAAAHRIAVRVSPSAAKHVFAANFGSSIVLGVFGPFGCKDGRVHVVRVTQSGTMLTVHVTIKPLAPGTAECQAIYETARVLVLPRAALHGSPTKAAVTVAGS